MTPILSDNYFVNFNKEAYLNFERFLKEFHPSKCFILVDKNTQELCLPILLNTINFSMSYSIITLESGEEFKNLETCNFIWNKLTDLGADRKSLLINLGGGVITDMGGFTASTFKRGISFVNIPTTLLSMVDASVGGKTGVDLGALKNQIGLFSNPKMVLVDTNYLKTLSQRELLSGLAEIIKYGLTYDIDLWHAVKEIKHLSINNITPLIYRSIEIKNEVVKKDPKEAGLRKILNFGHTLGHAIESYFLASKDKEPLTHGEAIAIGMIMESYLSFKILNFSMSYVEEIKAVIQNLYSKINISSSDFDKIIGLLTHDKKNVNGEVNFVLLNSFKNCQLDCTVEKMFLIEALNYYSN